MAMAVAGSNVETRRAALALPLGAVLAASAIFPAEAAAETYRVKLEGAVVSRIAEQAYTGQTVKPPVSVEFKGHVLEEGTDYSVAYRNNRDAGWAVANVMGRGAYKGTYFVPFKIRKAYLNLGTEVTFDRKEYMAGEGGARVERLSVKDAGGRQLEEGLDYEVSYENNDKPGTASVVITGKGSYVGRLTRHFEVHGIS